MKTSNPIRALAALPMTRRKWSWGSLVKPMKLAVFMLFRHSSDWVAPHWDEAARGLICGLTRGTRQNQVAWAVIESIAYQVRDVFDAIQEEAGMPLQALLADGGATRNDQLMQFQADILDCRVLRNSSPDVSALGSAFLAGLATGVWSDVNQIAALSQEFDRFDPQMSESRRADLYQGWQTAVGRATGQINL